MIYIFYPQCLEWRRANRVDTINQEDWTDMIAEHSYKFDAVDLQGRPGALFFST